MKMRHAQVRGIQRMKMYFTLGDLSNMVRLINDHRRTRAWFLRFANNEREEWIVLYKQRFVRVIYHVAKRVIVTILPPPWMSTLEEVVFPHLSSEEVDAMLDVDSVATSTVAAAR